MNFLPEYVPLLKFHYKANVQTSIQSIEPFISATSFLLKNEPPLCILIPVLL